MTTAIKSGDFKFKSDWISRFKSFAHSIQSRFSLNWVPCAILTKGLIELGWSNQISILSTPSFQYYSLTLRCESLTNLWHLLGGTVQRHQYEGCSSVVYCSNGEFWGIEEWNIKWIINVRQRLMFIRGFVYPAESRKNPFFSISYFDSINRKLIISRGKSFQHLTYEISHFSKGFLD